MSEQPQKQQEFKTVDIVDFSMQNNPLKVNDAFNQLISSTQNNIDLICLSETSQKADTSFMGM